MALTLNEEQTMLRDSAREFLQQRAPVQHLRSLRDDESATGMCADLWREMTELGWPAIAIDESDGGLGFGFTGLGIVLQETGRTLTPSPLLTSAMMSAAAIRHGASATQRETWLPDIAAGQSILVPACDEQTRHNPEAIETRIENHGGELKLTGARRHVPDGMAADAFLVSARNEEGDIVLVRVAANATGLAREPVRLLDTHIGAHLRFDAISLSADDVLGGPGDRSATLHHLLDTGVIGQSAELLGVASEAFERTLNYLRERKQFGVPIGSFQALQHRAADLCNDLELGTSLVLHALHRLDQPGGGNELPSLSETASMTKARLAAIAMRATAEAIQMHGGIGMTDEFDIGFFYKRARILETLLGDRHFHLDRFARLRGY
ncbi:acyl-CoA dehydrogenase family protein [Elongatibacter sediminis]|uniref:Acyl-CoA dehydrogenase family protein n=1 Tax=Elongatibacter sediminis TaxID=3119006 RepID=A0AAW9RH32_9GAMM